PFGSPCDGLTAAPALAECLLRAAATAADGALAAQFPDPGFCGDVGDAVEARRDTLLAQMTLDEKMLQMHGGGLAGIARTAGVERLGVPGLTMMDGPRGVGVTGGNATAFPVGIARGATWDPALEQRVGDAIGREARAKGVSVILAPTINLLRHPRWGRTQETYSEDTYHLGRMGVGFIRGAQQQVIANPKHFAANSIEDTRFTVDVQIDERSLREVYLPQFRAAVQEADAGSVMSAYNQVNGLHCEENPHLLRDVLKGDWGFQGFVESDWVLGTHHTVPAALAGLDIEMPIPRFYGPALAAAVGDGSVPLAVIDEAVRRIVRTQICFRLDSAPPIVDPTQVETSEAAAVALAVAQESLVLLKNAGAALPLDRDALASIAVVGELAAVVNLGDRGSSSVAPSHTVSPLDGLRSRAGAVPVAHFAALPLSADDRADIAAADAAIVVAGLTFLDEGEGLITTGDREGLAMPAGQDALIAEVAALNPRTIVVLEGSGALLMPWLDDVAAVVMAWYPGQEGGTAIADVLFGDVVPSGKLPMSFPRAEADLPLFDNVSPAVTYDLFHGYRHLDLAAATPLFPFGFGLSYTTFSYANLRVSPPAIEPYGRVRVTAEVTNTGTVAGAEVAQLYVGYPGSGVARAVRELKGFNRVDLAPGETRTVVFDLRAADLMFWDTPAAAWALEPIDYSLHVGSSSRDLPMTGVLPVAE
ncbi:MAG: beta-glucosidase, partial [Candidatus Binatia bacterium]